MIHYITHLNSAKKIHIMKKTNFTKYWLLFLRTFSFLNYYYLYLLYITIFCDQIVEMCILVR